MEKVTKIALLLLSIGLIANFVLTLVLVVPKINGLISVGNAAGKPDKKIYEKALGILKKTPVVDG